MGKTLRKIIYFDETSAIDLLQIEKKGNFSRTTEIVKNFSGKLDAGGGAKAGIDTNANPISEFVGKATGLVGSLTGNLDGIGKIQGNRIVTTLLENSLLYDFLDTVEFRKRKPLLDIDEGYSLTIPKDSMTYFATIAPLTEMMEGHPQVDDSEITMAVSKMNSGIRDSKGYYEVVGKKGSETRVFRFNIESFKNNYRIQDLKKMQLTLYSIEVGETRLSQLDFETEFELNNTESEIGFKGFNYQNEENSEKPDIIVRVFDVLLAGVK